VSGQLGAREKHPRGRPLETGRSRLLTGLLFCGVCGGRMMRASGNQRGPFITCRMHHRAARYMHNRHVCGALIKAKASARAAARNRQKPTSHGLGLLWRLRRADDAGERQSARACRMHHRAARCTHNRHYKLEKVEAVVIQMVREMLKNPAAAGMFVERFIEACRQRTRNWASCTSRRRPTQPCQGSERSRRLAGRSGHHRPR
jgi:hypothetical protein